MAQSGRKTPSVGCSCFIPSFGRWDIFFFEMRGTARGRGAATALDAGRQVFEQHLTVPSEPRRHIPEV